MKCEVTSAAGIYSESESEGNRSVSTDTELENPDDKEAGENEKKAETREAWMEASDGEEVKDTCSTAYSTDPRDAHELKNLNLLLKTHIFYDS